MKWLYLSLLPVLAYTDIRVVPVDKTLEPDHIETRIVFPDNNEMETSCPVRIKARVTGFPLGIDTDFPRKEEIANRECGQSIHIFIDDMPYFAVYNSLNQDFDDDAYYAEDEFTFNIPFSLQPGMHVIRILPARSYGESVKDDQGFAASVFYYRCRQKSRQVDLCAPYLTYNEPQGCFPCGKPVLLDFYLTNVQLSSDGYKVRLTIDGTSPQTLTKWTPYYIYGLARGEHTVLLELLDPQNNVVSGMFNSIQRTISIR